MESYHRRRPIQRQPIQFQPTQSQLIQHQLIQSQSNQRQPSQRVETVKEQDDSQLEQHDQPIHLPQHSGSSDSSGFTSIQRNTSSKPLRPESSIRRLFDSADINGSGQLGTEELLKVLRNGDCLTDKILGLLVNKYDEIDTFFQIAVAVKGMTDSFNRTAHKDSGVTEVDYEQFLERNINIRQDVTTISNAVGESSFTPSIIYTEPMMFNILVLGEKKSGKSTLINAIKAYTNQEVLGPEISSYIPTTEVTSTVVTTTLPRFSIFEKADSGQGGSIPRQLSNSDICQHLSLADDIYNQQKSRLYFERDQQPKNPHNFSFRLIDTPGMDSTEDGSKRQSAEEESDVFVSKTLPAIIDQLGPTRAVHLVLLVISDESSFNHTSSIDFCQNILPELNSVTIHAYKRTGRNKVRSVPGESQQRHDLRDGSGDTESVYILFNNLSIKNDPIRACLAQNDIRRILEMTLLSEPVVIWPRKPRFIKGLDGRLKVLDDCLKDRYSEELRTIHDTVTAVEESNPFRTILELAGSQRDGDARNEFALSSPPIKLIFSRRFENTWDAPTIDSTINMDMESSGGEITQVDILQHSVEIVKQEGGKGSHRFSLSFRWTSNYHGVLYVRIYVGGATSYSTDIRKEMTKAIQGVASRPEDSAGQRKLITDFQEIYKLYNVTHHLALNPVVYLDKSQILSALDIEQLIPIDLDGRSDKLEEVSLERTDPSQKDISAENASHETTVGQGNRAETTHSAINKPGRPLLDRRIETWTKVEYNDSISRDTARFHATPDTNTTSLLTNELVYNILVLGETQSGKSTLIEGIKRYADPTYKIDEEAIGDGIFSHTPKVRTSEVTTNMPPYYVFETSKTIEGKMQKSQIDYGRFIEMDRDDYEDAINRRRGYELTKGTSDQSERRFKLIDTPGLNNTNNFDEIYIGSITEALEGIRDLHLVLITVPNVTLSDGVKDAIKCYVGMLPTFKGILAFVHTRMRYGSLHPEDMRFAESMSQKKKALEDITKAENVPHFMIDCDLKTVRPIQLSITQNTIRSILSLATFNQPVRVTAMTMVKTARMADADKFLEDRYKSFIEARKIAFSHMDLDRSEVLAAIGELMASISEKEHELQHVQRELSLHRSDELVLLNQQRFDQGRSPLTSITTERMILDSTPYPIDHIDVLCQNVSIIEKKGGKGLYYWEAKFRMTEPQHGVLHVKLYIKKRNKYQEEIRRWEAAVSRLRGEIENLRNNLLGYQVRNQELQGDIEALLSQIRSDQYLLSQVSENELDIGVFYELVNSGAYVRSMPETVEAVEKFFLKNRARLENQAGVAQQVLEGPVDTSTTSVGTGMAPDV
ncbi:hypothetical protein BGX20_007367 [Mortierella sp. AD010]|nr:hypothetical protein BGX20_007367 [Mortierella sp. AD010]